MEPGCPWHYSNALADYKSIPVNLELVIVFRSGFCCRWKHDLRVEEQGGRKRAYSGRRGGHIHPDAVVAGRRMLRRACLRL
jgi:hypothetical protein